MAPARVWMVGLGRIWLRQHQRRLARLQPMVQPIVCCDVNPERRAAAAQDIPHAQIMADYHNLLARPEVDTALVCTLIAFNAPIRLAVASGSPCLAGSSGDVVHATAGLRRCRDS